MADTVKFDALLDDLLKDCQSPEDILGQHGLLKQLTQRLVERALEGELTAHLGYDPHELGEAARAHRRNGRGSKRLQTEAWESLEEAMARMLRIIPKDIQERMRDAHWLYRKLSMWLDQQPVTCPSCDHSYPAGTWNGNSHACPGCRALYWIGIAAG